MSPGAAMTSAIINGIELCYEMSGDGAPVLFVHGSCVDQTTWSLVSPLLANSFRTITYDRRGHGRSAAAPGRGTIDEDVEDLAALIRALALGPVHLVGNSFGASIALRLAARSPALIGTLAVHEPPLVFYLTEDLEQIPVLEELVRIGGEIVDRLARGDTPGAARQFVDELSIGSGGWKSLSEEQRQVFVANVRTWLDEQAEPAAYDVDRAALAKFARPVLLSEGGLSPKHVRRVVQKILSETLPGARHVLVERWGHIPHLTHPAEYAAMLKEFAAPR